ncbi:MAG: TlpA disulfide reductase family protein [Methylicorpusculum sp.]|uniref:peroxiredoxin family protein n=1 Tax=Methylicorpusculum sp. TaxID=2713644 RepID=UPI0027216F2E|nr:TlpA disulfide reductase family protein [Methylicorpusculum sp.]MDO8842814.1 TlpA disulfide reductase family protein [Methylicorpusculum sp.]MDO8939394.1 TlpA disulfide reductase family protein [Methylicorpusculum sp.]MDO9238591.1 TlpA disulfide reductase family protein [Methylicorpusculum sp.]MDP2179882.1 TlpA disulfide reductase family protein [Methylicorpusculum sp.]MDP2201793.1 TlpA disulfide reductase family protein [Methylicorpusculum sp.]
MPFNIRIMGLALALLITAAVFWTSKNQSLQAPDVSFLTITGQTLQLSSFKGKPVIVTFWATDCAVCVKEIPDLIDLYQTYRDKGLEIIAIAMYYDPPNHVVEMSKAKQIPYHVALDLRAEQARAFGEVRLTPTTFVIDADGMIVQHITGAFKPAELSRLIETLLVTTRPL